MISKRQRLLNTLLPLALLFGTGWGSSAVSEESASTSAMRDNTRIVINVPSRKLMLYQGQELLKEYPVGVGRTGFPTPLGNYQVIRKIVDPGWYNPYLPQGQVYIPPGQQNPLGTRWIGFKNHPKSGQYGIHGTDRPETVGKFVSHGCVRMRTQDVEEIFDQVSMGTPVEVRYDLIAIKPQGSNLRLVVYPDWFRRGMPNLTQAMLKIKQYYPNAKLQPAQVALALQKRNGVPVTVGTYQPANDIMIAEQPEKPTPSATEAASGPAEATAYLSTVVEAGVASEPVDGGQGYSPAKPVEAALKEAAEIPPDPPEKTSAQATASVDTTSSPAKKSFIIGPIPADAPVAKVTAND